MTRVRSAIRIAVGLITCGVLAAASAAQPTDLKKEGKKVFSPTPATPATGDRAQPGDLAAHSKDWVIMIAAFRGTQTPEGTQVSALDEAAAALTKVRSEGQLPGAYLQQRGPNVCIAVGGFADAAAEDAQAELKRVRTLAVSGEYPYAASFLAPPVAGAPAGSMPDMELTRAGAAAVAAGQKVKYTLEVGYYGRPDTEKPTEADLAEFRKAAEEAAVRLRAEGEQAFYYHGQTRSSVTVGMFDDTDIDPQVPSFRSARLAAARSLHPYHFFNGQPYKVKSHGATQGKFTPCPLVRIPVEKAGVPGQGANPGKTSPGPATTPGGPTGKPKRDPNNPFPARNPK